MLYIMYQRLGVAACPTGPTHQLMRWSRQPNHFPNDRVNLPLCLYEHGVLHLRYDWLLLANTLQDAHNSIVRGPFTCLACLARDVAR